MIVWVLIRRLSFKDIKTGEWKLLDLKGTYVYIHEEDAKSGRLQLPNNWSSYWVSNPKNVWVGMEFLCQKEDNLGQMEDQLMSEAAINELTDLAFVAKNNMSDATISRMKSALPIHSRCYDRFYDVRKYLDSHKNIYLSENRGYHNFTRSSNDITSALITVNNIRNGNNEKHNIWGN